ncbi:hypothetical protein FF1_003670 [Malus domestica]
MGRVVEVVRETEKEWHWVEALSSSWWCWAFWKETRKGSWFSAQHGLASHFPEPIGRWAYRSHDGPSQNIGKFNQILHVQVNSRQRLEAQSWVSVKASSFEEEQAIDRHRERSHEIYNIIRLCHGITQKYAIFLGNCVQIRFVLLISRQGKVRLTKWYSPYTQKERNKVLRELSGVILARGPKLCNFVDWRGYKVVYKRYASLYFCMCIDQEDNELEVLEMIHHFVEILDRYFGSVCELDLIFNFHKAYYILDEILIAGELQESSKKTVARLIAAQDSLVETAKEQASSISNIIAQATK